VRIGLIVLALLSFCYVAGCDKPSGDSGPPVPWGASDVETAEQVAASIDAKDAPIVIHVGPEVLFERGHVKGARYGGEAGTDEGLAKLAVIASSLPKDRDVVIYCGCCPRSDCPNIRPAYTKLKSLGLRVKVLDMPSNFKHDWQSKGFPVDKS
jgi:thiosulfate/3-mercaptopyruvate sulfurtransferase